MPNDAFIILEQIFKEKPIKISNLNIKLHEMVVFVYFKVASFESILKFIFLKH